MWYLELNFAAVPRWISWICFPMKIYYFLAKVKKICIFLCPSHLLTYYFKLRKSYRDRYTYSHECTGNTRLYPHYCSTPLNANVIKIHWINRHIACTVTFIWIGFDCIMCIIAAFWTFIGLLQQTRRWRSSCCCDSRAKWLCSNRRWRRRGPKRRKRGRKWRIRRFRTKNTRTNSSIEKMKNWNEKKTFKFSLFLCPTHK